PNGSEAEAKKIGAPFPSPAVPQGPDGLPPSPCNQGRETMQRGRFIFGAALALAAAGVWAANPPATTTTPAAPMDVVNLDFSKSDVASQIQINGDAKLVTDSGKQRLRLTDG